MNRIVCEMCGNSDFMKENGVFVCQSCGCKYSAEEAKKMMIDGTVHVEGTVKVDNSSVVDNYLKIANNSLNGGNGKEAFEYANKALEVAPNNVDAWLLKMKSVKYLGTIGNPRIAEVITCGNKAIQSAIIDDKASIEYLVYEYYLTQTLTLLIMATNKFGDLHDLRETHSRYQRINNSSANSNTQKSDASLVKLYEDIGKEAMGLFDSVPDKNLEESKEFQRLIGEIAKQYQLMHNNLALRYDIYFPIFSDSTRLIGGSKSDRIKQKLISSAVFEFKIMEKKKLLEKEFAERHPIEYEEIQKMILPIKSQYDSFSANDNMLKLSQNQIKLFQEQMEWINLDIIKDKKIIKQNQPVFFGKEKAKLVCNEAQNKIDKNELKLRDIETKIQKFSEDIDNYSEIIEKIRSENGPLLQQIANLYEEKIYKGLGK